MKKVIISAVTAATMLFGTAASAQSPHTYPWTVTGVFNLQKGTGPQLFCPADVTFDMVGVPAVKKITSIILSPVPDPRCQSVIFVGAPWDVSNDPLDHGTFTIHDLYADTTITDGDCAGDLTANWNGTNWDINGILPQVTTGGDCTVEGELEP